jgi:hypothetical protein
MYRFHHPESRLAARPGKGRALLRLCSLLLAGVLVLAGTACRRPESRAAGALKPASPPVWVVSFGHSESDQAEEPGHLVDFEKLFLPRIEDERATVIVYTVGLAGLGSPRVIARADFDTAGRDGDNPHKRATLRGLARRQLLDSVRNGLAATKFSPGSDSFGGLAAAANFLAQYPPSSSKTLLAFGDQVANLPQGCVLDSADLSPGNRPALLRTCSPALPNLRGVRVLLAGAGYSEDDYIDTALAQGLEGLYREFFPVAGAEVDLYGPVAVNGGVR